MSANKFQTNGPATEIVIMTLSLDTSSLGSQTSAVRSGEAATSHDQTYTGAGDHTEHAYSNLSVS